MGLPFRTGQLVDAIFTDTSNNVGIGGAPSGSYKFEVTGTAKVSGAATFSSSVTATSEVDITGGDGAGKMLKFVGGTTKYNWMIAAQQNVNNALEITPSSAAGGSTFSTPAVVVTSGGNVGIGTTSPSYPLTVISNSSTQGFRLAGRSSDNIANISFTSNDQATEYAFMNTGATYWAIGTNGSERMRITSGGNVLIGTTTDNGSKLQVSGSVTTSSSTTIFPGFLVKNTTNSSYALYQSQTNNSSLWQWGTWNDNSFRIGVSGVADYQTITSGGYVYLGPGYGATNHRIDLAVAQGTNVLVVSGYNGGANDTAIFYSVSGASPNAAATALGVMTNSSTGRSINAGGTINASGADYAEYIEKAVTDIINKGDIVGIDVNAKVTNIFADAISFAVKSTNPSYVGGDIWATHLGKIPSRTTDQTEEEFAPILAEFEAKVEIERQKVDRISFSGQVPCNVINANVGDYIIPIELENGKIGGQAVTNPTFEQYQISVGKVWKIMEDGRAWIAVKIG